MATFVYKRFNWKSGNRRSEIKIQVRRKQDFQPTERVFVRVFFRKCWCICSSSGFGQIYSKNLQLKASYLVWWKLACFIFILLNLWVILVPNVFIRTGKSHMTLTSCDFHRKNLKNCVTHIWGDTHRRSL